MSKPIGLSEFIDQVKRDLLTKQSSTEDPVPLFAITEVEVEVSVVATREVEGGLKGGINLAILGLGTAEASGGGKVGHESAQTVRVKLSPLLTKEQLLERMEPAVREKVLAKAAGAIPRGERTLLTDDLA
jgi:hypothetical protein